MTTTTTTSHHDQVPTTSERIRTNKLRLERTRSRDNNNNQNNNKNALSSPWTHTESLSTLTRRKEEELFSNELNELENGIVAVELPASKERNGRERSRTTKRGLNALHSRSRNTTSARESQVLGDGSSSTSSRLRSTTFDLDFEEEEGGGEEGDAEDSAVDEFQENNFASINRGRGRTRKREENPFIMKSMLEDALRTSLATLLSLTPHQSQSFASLTTFFSPTIVSPMLISPASASRPLSRNSTFTSVISALTGVEEKEGEYSDNDDDDEVDSYRIEEQDRKEWEEETTSSAESLVQVELDNDDQFSASSESISSSAGEEQENLKPSSSLAYSHSRSIPIASTSHLSEPLVSTSLPNPSLTSKFSPIITSRTTRALSTSSSSEDQTSQTSSHRRSRRRRSITSSTTTASIPTGRDQNRTRNRTRGRSHSPGPATNEERFRAREKARIRDRMITDVEDEKLEVDEEFKNLMDAAVNFMSMPKRTNSIASTSSNSTNRTVLPNFGSTDLISESIDTNNLSTRKFSSVDQLVPTFKKDPNLLHAGFIPSNILTPYSLSPPSTISPPLSDLSPLVELLLPFTSSVELESEVNVEVSSSSEKSLEGGGREGKNAQATEKVEEEEVGILRKGWRKFSTWWRTSFEFPVRVWHLLGMGSVIACVGLGAVPISRAAIQFIPSLLSINL